MSTDNLLASPRPGTLRWRQLHPDVLDLRDTEDRDLDTLVRVLRTVLRKPYVDDENTVLPWSHAVSLDAEMADAVRRHLT